MEYLQFFARQIPVNPIAGRQSHWQQIVIFWRTVQSTAHYLRQKNNNAPGKGMKRKLIAGLSAVLCMPFTGWAQQDALYFPPTNGDWETVAPASVGWDAGALDAALAVAGERDSTGVVVLHNGRIMAERYWEAPEVAAYELFLQGYDEAGRAIEDVASAQKSVVATLAGMAQERGFLNLADSVSEHLGAGWSEASIEQEQAITLQHLLSMTSGLATDFSFETEPDFKWLYNTPVYHVAMRVLMTATGLDRNGLTVGWISEPLGMQNTAWTPRPWADAAIATGLSTTARDLARFGLMIQAGGQWAGQTIIADTDFLKAMQSPSQSLNPAYGLLWWLNGQEFARDSGANAARIDGPLIPAAPADLVAMQGAGDRKLYLVPSLELVITRLGYTGAADGVSFNEAFWSALMKAAPGSH